MKNSNTKSSENVIDFVNHFFLLNCEVWCENVQIRKEKITKWYDLHSSLKKGPQLLMENLSLRLFWKHMQIVSLHNHFHLLRRGHRAASFATESRRRPEMASQLIYSVARLISYFFYLRPKNSVVLTILSNENDNVPKIYT